VFDVPITNPLRQSRGAAAAGAHMLAINMSNTISSLLLQKETASFAPVNLLEWHRESKLICIMHEKLKLKLNVGSYHSCACCFKTQRHDKV
jgi:hypothetical protein